MERNNKKVQEKRIKKEKKRIFFKKMKYIKK